MTGIWPILVIPVIVILGIFFSAWLVHSRVEIPGTFRIKKLDPEEMDPVALSVLAKYDDEIQQLGFEKIGDFEVADLAGENLHRVFINRQENTSAMVSLFATGFRKMPHLEFYTKFQDQSSLSTDQAGIPNYFEIPPDRKIQRFPGLNPFLLYQIHKQGATEMIAQGRMPISVSQDFIFKFIEQDQQDLLNYQIKKGFMLTDSENDLLRPSWKFAFYFIIRNLDPFPIGISNAKFVSALLIDAAIMYGVFAFVRWGNVQKLLSDLSLSEMQIYYSFCSAGAVVSSLLLGFLIQRRAFLWAGLISALGIFLFIHNLFPNDWILILISAQAGFVGNRIYESRLLSSPTRLPAQFLVLIVLIAIGWIMLTPK